MAASFPGAVKNFSSVVNGVTKLVAALFQSPYDEITAIETALGANMSNVRFGAWVDKTSSYGVQQAATDGIVIARSSGQTTGYTDSNSNPTTQGGSAYGDSGCVVMPVRKGDYWKLTQDTGTITWVRWLPSGG